MCLHVNKFSLKINEVVAPFELHLFILDEIGTNNLCQPALCSSTQNGAGNSRKPLVVDHDIGEDG